MSQATKRKHVVKEVTLDDLVLPAVNQSIVCIVASRGNNLHEVDTCLGERFLVSMPTKYRKNVWVKRGNFVLIEPIDEGDKVRGEIVMILTPEHIKYFKKEKVWPEQFDKKSEVVQEGDLFENTNRRVQERCASSSSSEATSGSESDHESK